MPPGIELPSTVSPLEIVWSLICLAGTIAAGWNCWDAWTDLQIVRREGINGALMLATIGEWIDQRLILLALACLLAVGLLAMTSLPGKEPDGDPSPASIFVPWVMILSAIALISLSFAKKNRRKRIMEYLREHP